MKLKELRKSKGVSQEEAANALGVSFRAYQNYEYEQREPNIEMLNKMADYFGTSVDKLLGRENKEQAALDELVGQFNMDLLEKKIVENYFALPKKMRGDLMTFLEKSVKEVTEESKNIYLKASRSADDRGPEIVTLTPEQKKRLDEAPDETQNPDNDI